MMRALAVIGLALASAGCGSSDFMKDAGKLRLDRDRELATVIFARPSSAAPNTIVTIVDAEGPRFLGQSTSSSCFAAKLVPGPHVLVGFAKNATGIPAVLEAGKVYFVQVEVKFGSLTSRTFLTGLHRTPQDDAKVARWKEDCDFYQADLRAGQAFLDEQEQDTVEQVRRANEIVRRLSEEERRQRALDSEDGRTE